MYCVIGDYQPAIYDHNVFTLIFLEFQLVTYKLMNKLIILSVNNILDFEVR